MKGTSFSAKSERLIREKKGGAWSPTTMNRVGGSAGLVAMSATDRATRPWMRMRVHTSSNRPTIAGHDGAVSTAQEASTGRCELSVIQ